MATINEINAGAQYTGNAALGGGNNGVITIDTRPLDALAFYTMSYNKAVWDQDQKEKDDKIKKIADLSTIHLNDLIGKDKEQATKEFEELVKFAGDYARKISTTTSAKLQDELEWQTKLGAFNNNYLSGKQRAISYSKQNDDINSNGNMSPAQKELAIEELNKKFNSTDIGTPISSMDNYKIEQIEVPKPVTQKVGAIAIGGDQNFETDALIYNPSLNAPIADATVMGIKKIYPEKGSEEYKNASPRQRLKYDYQASVDSQGKIWADMAVPLNKALRAIGTDGKFLYFDDNGNFKSQKFEDENASNSVVMRAYMALKRLDSDSRNKFQQASDPSGVFTDKGVKFKLKVPINPNDFKAGFIDFSKEITPSQLVQAGMFAQHSGDVFDIKVTETGKATAIKLKKMDESGANYRALLPYKMAKISDKLKADEQQKMADEFGNLIYGINVRSPFGIGKSDNLDSSEIVNGTLIDKDGKTIDYTGDVTLPARSFDNSIITEYNKYVGQARQDKNGNVLSTAAPTKLQSVDGGYKIRLKNGEIDGIYADDGSLVTVQQFKHITLTAGQQGVTKYKKTDTEYGKFENTINISDVPAGTKLDKKNGQFYYQGKKVIQ